ncbi:MAG TPA: tetratricopeptide repeat protein [Chroococcales cyanobacterium]
MAANPLLDQGIKLFRQASYDQAVAVLERVGPSDQKAYAEALALLGRIHTKRRQFQQAKEMLERSIRIMSTPRTIYYQGECFFFEGDHVSAYRALKQAIKLDGGLTDAFILLGRVERERGQFAEAIALFEQALRNDTMSLAARYQLALTAFMSGDLVRASAQAFVVKQAKDDFAPVHKLLGEIAMKMGDHRQTVVEFCRLVELAEMDAELFFKMGNFFLPLPAQGPEFRPRGPRWSRS